MARNTQDAFSVLSAATTAVAAGGIWMKVTDFRHFIFNVNTTGSTTATIKVMGSIQETEPNLAAAASVTNQWAPISFYDLDTAGGIAGSTGIVIAGTDINKLYQVNMDGLTWINFIITSISAGSVNVTGKTFNDCC